MDTIAARIRDTLEASGLTVRTLAAIAKVHYTTIYLILRKGTEAKPLKVIEESLDRSVNQINALVAENKLPLPANLSQAVRRNRLHELIDELVK